METYDILITSENIESFSSVLPVDYMGEGDRIAIGCYAKDGSVLGAVSFIFVNYQIDLDWLYVDPKVRRQGIATKLMDRVIAFASETMEFYPISAQYCLYDKVNPIHEFFVTYDKMDVTYSHERYFVKDSDIAMSPLLHKKLKNRLTQKPFFSEPEATQKRVLSMIGRNGRFTVENFDDWKKLCVKELCRCDYIGNTLMDLVFVQKNPDGNLKLALLYSKYPEGLLCMMSSVARAIELRYAGATLSFDALSNEAMDLAEKIFPNAETRRVFEATW